MSKKQAEILTKLEQIGKQGPVLIAARVVSVDEQELTCQIDIEGVTMQARLSAAINSGKGLAVIPSVNSWVLAGRLDENGDIWAVLSFTDADKIIMRNGENGGLVIGGNLAEKLNAIEQDINSLKQAFTNWVPAPMDGGLALKTLVTDWAAQSLSETQAQDIENDKILH